MKTLMTAFIAFLSLQAFAADYSGNLVQPEDFEALERQFSLEEKSLDAYPFWRSSISTCYAQTICPNGRRIFCRAYGYNNPIMPAGYGNSCRWMVLPGRAVRCQGYSMQRDYYGRAYWAFIDIPVSCY